MSEKRKRSFSEFIREASIAEKKRVFEDVLERASGEQRKVVERHELEDTQPTQHPVR